MSTPYHLKLLFLSVLLLMPAATVSADPRVYMEFAPSLLRINTPAATTRPLMVDFRLGYEFYEHQYEAALMTSVKEDKLNQLTVDVPSVLSVLYHYVPDRSAQLKLHFILGGSYIHVDSSYPGIGDGSDYYYGLSYGIGFEEAFASMPQLKLSLDWIQLYHGDRLRINTTSLGIHYEF